MDEDTCQNGLFTLPDDILARVVVVLTDRDLACVACTCHRLRSVCDDDERVWAPRCDAAFGDRTDVQRWISRKCGRDVESSQPLRSATLQWPPQSARSVLGHLENLQQLIGFWHHSTPAGVESLFSFRWASDCVVCLRLDSESTYVGHAERWRVICSLSCQSPELPGIEVPFKELPCIRISPGSTPVARAPSTEAKVAAALGSASYHADANLGTSPSGSFESEMLAFMSAQSPPSASRKRRNRRPRTNSVYSRWALSLDLVRVNLRKASVTHPLSGAWYGWNYDVDTSSVSLEVILVGYNFRESSPTIVATKMSLDADCQLGPMARCSANEDGIFCVKARATALTDKVHYHFSRSALISPCAASFLLPVKFEVIMPNGDAVHSVQEAVAQLSPTCDLGRALDQLSVSGSHAGDDGVMSHPGNKYEEIPSVARQLRTPDYNGRVVWPSAGSAPHPGCRIAAHHVALDGHPMFPRSEVLVMESGTLVIVPKSGDQLQVYRRVHDFEGMY